MSGFRETGGITRIVYELGMLLLRWSTIRCRCPTRHEETCHGRAPRSWIRSLLARKPRTFRRDPARLRLSIEALEDRLTPATLTVNSMADTANATDAYLSLREAIAIVNSATLPSGLSSQITGQISGTLHGGNAEPQIVFDHTKVTAAITLGGAETGVEPGEHNGVDRR